jgi:ketosteroid isomerase-like protein
MKKHNEHSVQLTPEANERVLQAVKIASEQWKAAFNRGDYVGCAAQYEVDAVMNAMPFGQFKGREAIQGFWQQLVADGFSDVDYVEPNVEVIDGTSAVLTSGWKMNKAAGVITNELWVLQSDGTAKLREDDFEAH